MNKYFLTNIWISSIRVFVSKLRVISCTQNNFTCACFSTEVATNDNSWPGGGRGRWRAEEVYEVVKTASRYGFVLWTTHSPYKSHANRKLRPLLQTVFPHIPHIFQVEYTENHRIYIHPQELQSLGSSAVYLSISVNSPCACNCKTVGNWTLDYTVQLNLLSV
jgi:hypothetical protein